MQGKVHVLPSHAFTLFVQLLNTNKLSTKIYPTQSILYFNLIFFIIYYGFGLGLDTRDSNAYVSCAKRTRCYAETATFPRANFLERK